MKLTHHDETVERVTTFKQSEQKKTSSFVLFIFTLYSPCHLTYRGSGRAIPLHALQTTENVFFG